MIKKEYELTIKTAKKIKKLFGMTDEDLGYMCDLVSILKRYSNKVIKIRDNK